MTVGTKGAGRDNNFNLIRLVLASLVIVYHSSLIIDGDRHRDFLFFLFRTVPSGIFAVHCFFLLSGFLIVQSWERNPNLKDFAANRVLRIFPAFIVASAVSIVVFGRLGASSATYYSQIDIADSVRRALLLKVPHPPETFHGFPMPGLNPAMWTIAYEFRCYALAALLGVSGFVNRRALWLAMPGAALLLYWNYRDDDLFNLFAYFSAGACFYLFRDRIVYTARLAALAAGALCFCLFWEGLAQAGTAVFGGYVLFWLAFLQTPVLQRLRKLPDISYGVYLYGWPIQKSLQWCIPSITPMPLFALSIAGSCTLGFLSWHLVEKWFLRLKRRNRPVAARAPLPQPAMRKDWQPPHWYYRVLVAAHLAVGSIAVFEWLWEPINARKNSIVIFTCLTFLFTVGLQRAKDRGTRVPAPLSKLLAACLGAPPSPAATQPSTELAPRSAES